MSRGRTLVLLIAVPLIAGGAVWVYVARADRGPEVRVEAVEVRDVISTITATGQVRARRQVDVSSDVMGRVTELTVREGDDVEAGQVLLTVDPSQLRALVSRARATLSQAEAEVAREVANLLQAERELARLEGIVEQDPDLVSLQAVEEAATAVEVQDALLTSARFGAEQAEAELAEASDQLARTTIRAPISGTVIRLNIEEGETAVIGTMNNPGSLLLTIGDLSGIEAVMAVDETDIPHITVGDSAVVELDAFPGMPLPARVSSIGNSAIQSGEGTPPAQVTGSVDFEVILALLDPPRELRPDLSATADIIVDRKSRVPAVPIISVTVRSEGADDESKEEEDPDEGDDTPTGPIARALEAPSAEGVFVVSDGVALWTPVVLGITGQEHFEIVSGIALGDTVVSGPYQVIQDLGDGDRIRVTGSGERPAS